MNKNSAPLKKTGRGFCLALVILASYMGMLQIAFANMTPYLGNNELAAFNTAAGDPPISIDFDSITSGTDISNSAISGIKLSSLSGNALTVINASTTFSFCCGAQYKLFATSGENVLSPGGANLAGGPNILQQDGLQINFPTPVSAFGIDLLFQSLDGASLTGVTIYGPDHVTPLYSNMFLNIPSQDGGGTYFLGFFSDNAITNIGRIVFNEFDNDSVNPDSNIGYDTLRFVAAPIPEPQTYTMLLAGLGLLGLMAHHRRVTIYCSRKY